MANDRKLDRKRDHRRWLTVGFWNMRTLVVAEGRVGTSVVRPRGRRVVVDRKAALMVHELKKYGVNIAGITVRQSGLGRMCMRLRGK